MCCFYVFYVVVLENDLFGGNVEGSGYCCVVIVVWFVVVDGVIGKMFVGYGV